MPGVERKRGRKADVCSESHVQVIQCLSCVDKINVAVMQSLVVLL